MAKGKNEGKPAKPPEFLVKLRRMLLDEPSEVIEYKSGRIYFHDPQKLLDGILRKYFKHNNFSSLHRQLNYFEYMKVKGKGTVEPCMYENAGMLGKDINRLLLLKRKKPLISGSTKGCMSFPSTPLNAAQTCVKKIQLKSEIAPPRETVCLNISGKQRGSQIISKDCRQGTPNEAKSNSAWPPTPTTDGDAYSRWAAQGGLTPKLARCQSDLNLKNQISNRRLSGNIKGFNRDWTWNDRAYGISNTPKEGVNHIGVHNNQESHGVIVPLPEDQDMDLEGGSEGWKDGKGTKGLEKMYQQRHSDVEMIDCRSIELLTPSPLPYSAHALQSAVKSIANPDTSDQVLAKGISTSHPCSLPLDTITNIAETNHAATNSLPSCTSQTTPRSSGSDVISSAEQNQACAFWMSLGWTDGGDFSLPQFGGAPKSAEKPLHPPTCSLVTPGALRSSPVGPIHDTNDILVTPSTLACLEEDHDIFQPNHAETIGILEEFGNNPFPSPFLQRKVGGCADAGQYCLN